MFFVPDQIIITQPHPDRCPSRDGVLFGSVTITLLCEKLAEHGGCHRWSAGKGESWADVLAEWYDED